MTPQQRNELFTKGRFLMMLSLVGNISLDGIQVRETHGKGPVSGLPGEAALRWKCFMNPFRRVAFDKPNSVGKGTLFGQRNQKMNVIGHSAGGQQATSVGPNNPAQVFRETCLKIVCDARLPVFGAENNVYMQGHE